MKNVRVRFAPSPTGDLHIGGVRTALFNWVFAKNEGGKFVLRIEDTDEVRSTKNSVKVILDALTWLGINWDEGPGNECLKYSPYYQMKRKKLGIYQKYADDLIAKGFAYPCYCTLEDVDDMRKKAMIKGIPIKYDGRCRYLTIEQRNRNELDGRKFVIRFKVPDSGTTTFSDSIRGEIKFDNFLLGDFVVVKASGVPAYNFACVVDDYLMEITHILRGDDHISNTPRQILVYNALGWEIPKFAHMSMILGEDGKRLSKRHGHMSILEYRKEGYLRETMINYLALLGWSTEDSQQIFTMEEFQKKFSIERCSMSPAIFDPAKLLWINGEKIRSKTPNQICELFIDWLGYINNKSLIKGWDISLLIKVIFLEIDKIKLLKDIPNLVDFFFMKDENLDYKVEAIGTILNSQESKISAQLVLTESIERFIRQENFSAVALEKCSRDLAAEKNIKTKEVFHPIRVAISGRMQGPSLFHMMEVMGKNRVLRRIRIAMDRFFK
jgi:glutamyl-tRNA synthetase